MSANRIGPVYVVTDAGAPTPVLAQARAAADGGAWAVQLRDKSAPDDDIRALTEILLTELGPRGIRVFVNDRIEVARSTGADLHIGQSDGDPRAARKAIGPDAMLGLSIEEVSQCAAIPDCVDYIGAGPIRATATKNDAAAPIGMAGLAAIVAASPVPVIAIGGLTAADAPALRRIGADGLAVVSAVTRAVDPEEATKNLLTAWRQA